MIKTLQKQELEKQELFRFGRLVVHDHPYFNALQTTLTDRVSDLAQEPVEPCYNFLSLYNNLGVCEVHMDAPYAKWTLDICIKQSAPWPIYFSQVRPWPEDFTLSGQDWQAQIKHDPENVFTEYAMEPGEGIVFSGSSQWHYRNWILNQHKNNFCHLVFFHFILVGTSDIIRPSNWARLYDISELKQLQDGTSEVTTNTVSGLLNRLFQKKHHHMIFLGVAILWIIYAAVEGNIWCKWSTIA